MTVQQSKRGRRRCLGCERRIDPKEEAVRVSNVKNYRNSVGRTRFWLCWRCAGVWEQAMGVMRKKGLQGGKVLDLA